MDKVKLLSKSIKFFTIKISFFHRTSTFLLPKKEAVSTFTLCSLIPSYSAIFHVSQSKLYENILRKNIRAIFNLSIQLGN